MEIGYQREIGRNYMIVRGEELTADPGFESRMLSENEIEGLLQFRMRRTGRDCEFCYEITSRQPLSRILQNRKLKGNDIRRIVRSLLKTVSTAKDYLLEENGILLTPDSVYGDPDTLEVLFCMVPGYRGDFCRDLSSFLKYLLEKTDHQDPDGIMTAYHLYEESRKENYGMADLLRCITRQEEYTAQDAEKSIKEEEDSLPEYYPNTEEESGPAGRTDPGEDGEIPRRRRKAGKTAGDILRGLPACAAAEFLLWYLLGVRGLILFGLIPPAVFGVWIVMRIRGRKENPEDRREERNPAPGRMERSDFPENWRIQPESTAEAARREEERRVYRLEKSYAEGTVALGRTDSPEILVLEPVRRNMEAVRITYTPFILGKHPELSDYCIREDSVSRMHARIDMAGDTFRVTDLNSTNGTSVDGRMLEANGTAVLEDGACLELAGVGFYVKYPFLHN